MRRVQTGLLAVLLVAVTAAPVAGAVGADGHRSGSTTGVDTVPAADRAGAGPAGADQRSPPDDLAIEADSITFRITVFENASARWTIVYTRSLDNDSERQQFEEFAARFNENETDVYRNFKEGAKGVVATGRNETGRDMRATAFTKRAYVGGNCAIPDDCGTVRMSFVWTAFARTDGDRVIVDDVYDGGGLYLGADRSVTFVAGPELRFDSVDPAPDSMSDPESLRDSETVTWQGQRDFSNRRPRVVYRPASTGTTETATDRPTTTEADPTTRTTTAGGSTGGGDRGDTSTAASGGGSSAMPMLLAGGLLLLALGAGFAVVRRRRGGGSGPAATVDPDDGAAGGAATADAVSGEPAVPDEELLTDEDKVVNLLQDNGGRMKQVDIVEETDWSKSKVSMLLSDMEEDGDISKLRVGRENIVSLAGHEPEAAGSPHDDE